MTVSRTDIKLTGFSVDESARPLPAVICAASWIAASALLWAALFAAVVR